VDHGGRSGCGFGSEHDAVLKHVEVPNQALCHAVFVDMVEIVAAEELGLEVGQVSVLVGDTNMPAASVQGASRTAATIGPIIEELVAAGVRADDRAWHMPLTEEYAEQLKSNFADFANVGGREHAAVYVERTVVHVGVHHPRTIPR